MSDRPSGRASRVLIPHRPSSPHRHPCRSRRFRAGRCGIARREERDAEVLRLPAIPPRRSWPPCVPRTMISGTAACSVSRSIRGSPPGRTFTSPTPTMPCRAAMRLAGATPAQIRRVPPTKGVSSPHGCPNWPSAMTGSRSVSSRRARLRRRAGNRSVAARQRGDENGGGDQLRYRASHSPLRLPLPACES